MQVPSPTPVILLLALAAAGSAAPASAAAEPEGGTLVRFQMNAPSLGEDKRNVRVYLPRSYETPAGAARRYPTVYLLHGWPGTEGNWPGEGRVTRTLDTLIAAGRIPEVIAVMPSAVGIGLLGRSMYLNSYDGSQRMEDFIVHDLVAWADRTFRTEARADRRAILGLSEGGSAAINLAFKHPDVFGACGSHSGDFLLTRGMGEGKILGPEPGATRLLQENSPLLYVDRIGPTLRGMTIYFDCGLDDHDEIAQNRELDRKLTALGIPHTYREFPGGHTWGYWRTHVRDALIALLSPMR